MDLRWWTVRGTAFLLCVGAASCVEHIAGPSPDVPLASAYPSVGSTFSEQPAPATDSRVPTIALSGDSVLVAMVVPTICGRDTVIAGAARDSLVVTLRRTLLPLPCAFVLPDVRLRVSVAARPQPHVVVVTMQTMDFADTTRAVVASATLAKLQATTRASANAFESPRSSSRPR